MVLEPRKKTASDNKSDQMNKGQTAGQIERDTIPAKDKNPDDLEIIE